MVQQQQQQSQSDRWEEEWRQIDAWDRRGEGIAELHAWRCERLEEAQDPLNPARLNHMLQVEKAKRDRIRLCSVLKTAQQQPKAGWRPEGKGQNRLADCTPDTGARSSGLQEDTPNEAAADEHQHSPKDAQEQPSQRWLEVWGGQAQVQVKDQGKGKDKDQGKDMGLGKGNGKGSGIFPKGAGNDKGNDKGKDTDKGKGKGKDKNSKGKDQGKGEGKGKDQGKGMDKGKGGGSGIFPKGAGKDKSKDKGKDKGKGKDKSS